MQTLETDRLNLRWITQEDSEFMLKLLNDPAFLRNIGDRNVRNIEESKAYITKLKEMSYDRRGFGNFLVIRKDTGEKIGICSLVLREALGDTDIGFAFLPEFNGKGYAFESSLAVFNHAKDDLKFNRLVGICDPSNTPSIRLLEKLGLQFEKQFLFNERDTLLYGITF